MSRFLIFLLLWGCTSYLYKAPLVSHVLAINELGDTVRIPIDEIRPTRIYNVVGYDYYDRYYRGQIYKYDWRYYRQQYDTPSWIYRNNYSPYGKINNIYPQNNTDSNIQSYGGNTTGGGNNPVAVNPVTAGGGSKKKNN